MRVLANGSSDDGIRGVQLTEVMVYGVEKAVRHDAVSDNMSASASSELGEGRGADNANDGIGIKETDQNFWSTAIGQSANAWWQMDLETVRNIGMICVEYRRVNLGDGNTIYRFVPKTVTVQVSSNGTDWQTVISKSGNVPAIYGVMPLSQEDIYTYSLDGASGRYVRLLFEDGTQDLDEDAIQLVEATVYESLYFERGDLNRDGYINIKDLVGIKKHMSSVAGYSYTADMNSDRAVDASDIALLRRYLIGGMTDQSGATELSIGFG